MIEISYPWPPRELSPNARCHWAVKSKAAAAYRATGAALTMVALFPVCPDFGDGKIHLFIDFYPPSKRRYDDDNCYSAIKSLRDGIADALGVNDRRFVGHPFLRDEVVKGGDVRIRFTTIGMESSAP